MRLLIALNEDNGITSKLSSHFGHCPYFAIYETNTKKLEFVKNEIDHSNQSITPVDQIMKFEPEMIFSLGMGKKAIDLFQNKEIKVVTGDFSTLQEVLNNLDNLKELSHCNHL